MFARLRSSSRTQKISYALFTLSGLMFFATVSFVFSNLDVLEDWKLILPEQKIHAGDRIIVQSVYSKKRTAEGTATRYLDCENKDGIILRYELNQRKANRAAHAGGTSIDVMMRTDVPDLPTKCRIAVAICYDTILPWYCYPESNETEEFTLYPQEIASATSEGDVTQETNQTPIPVTGQASSSGSSSNFTPTEEPVQSNISQPEPKGLVGGLIDGLNSLLGGL